MRINEKIINYVFTYCFFTLSTSAVIVNTAEDYVYLVSSKGVEVTFLNYEKLLKVGYTENEIKSISFEEYNKITNMNIILKRSLS